VEGEENTFAVLGGEKSRLKRSLPCIFFERTAKIQRFVGLLLHPLI
jgi:hypothetical protein